MRKFNLGDMVWTMCRNAPVEWEVWAIRECYPHVPGPPKKDRIEFDYTDRWANSTSEDKVFATKQELLDSL